MGSSKSDNICNSSKDILTNTCCPSESTAAQESSIFGDISNLSPVQPLKDAAILQGFPGITSPPNVLTSPHINPQSSFLNRQQQCHTSSSEYSQGNVDLEKTTRILDDPGSSNPQSSIAVESSDRNGCNAIAFTQLQPVNALIAVDKLLVAPVDEEFIDSGRRGHLDAAPKTLGSVMEKKDSMKDNCLASENSTMLLKRADECSIGGFVSDVNQMKNENYQFVATSEVCSDVISKPFMDHAHAQRECGESLHEVNHIQSGVLRRCLQFGEHQQKYIRESSDDTTERQMSISDLSQNYSPETPYNRHVADQFEFASPMCLPSCTSAVVSKPRGIGLHLNSIVAGQRVDVVTGKQSSKGMVKLGGKSLILSGGITHVLSSDNVEKISSISEADLHLTESVEVTTPNKLLLPDPDTAKPLDLPILLNPAGEELAESSGESNQAGSNTRKKQASNFANPDGCKRCSCKKSKCLKLYCDCFAAGLYCADSCSCKGCFNRPEQKESVIEARQLIESRNPLAFAPRIMQHVANSPTNSGESGEPVAPPSLRHKRGCNCRKSMCLKKYCECYEANVGCSDGCRCEGCKNVYGKKPDYSLSRHITNKRTFDEISEETPDQKHKLLITSRRHLSKEKGSDSPVAVPVTPTLPCSDSRKNEMKSLLPGRRYVLSPDPNLHTPPSAIHQSSSRSSLVEATQIHGGLVNLCHFTRLTNPLQTTTPMVAPSSNATTNAIQEAPPKPPFCEILKSESPEYLLSNVYLGDDTTDSDTPLILRDSSAPVKSVKVSSPNKKRVSPPHNHLNELRPSSSGELRSSRKFIFRSVPKFPPLSPCLDPNNLSDPPADTH